MSSFANQLSLFFFLVTIVSSHARESPFFTKISPTSSKQPDDLPETVNVYGQDSDKLPNYAAESAPELPENNNPFSYITEQEGVVDGAKFASSNSNTNNDDKDLYDGPKNEQLTPEERQAEYRNSNYNGGGGDLARLSAGLNRSNDGGVEANEFEPQETSDERSFEPQGMSDTRSFENGKYHYDIDAEKFNGNHPYETVKNGLENNYSNDNGENGYGFNDGKNFVAGYESQNDIQEEEDVNSQP